MTKPSSRKGERHHSGLSQDETDSNSGFKDPPGKVSLNMGNEINSVSMRSPDLELLELFDENIITKIWRVAATVNQNVRLLQTDNFVLEIKNQ